MMIDLIYLENMDITSLLLFFTLQLLRFLIILVGYLLVLEMQMRNTVFSFILLLLPGQLEIEEEDYLDGLGCVCVQTDEESRDEEGDHEDYHYDEN